MDSASLTLWMRAPSSALVSDDMIFLIIKERTRIAPLMGGGGESGRGEIVVFLGGRLRKK